MPRYTPIPVQPTITASHSDMVELRWRKGGITADFIIPDDERHALRVTFGRAEIIRLLDEMPLSTEQDTRNEGLVAENFAYMVEGASFWEVQSWALKVSQPGLKHYRFITGWQCMDVISNCEPAFTVVPLTND